MLVQKSDDDAIPDFKAIFLIVNDLFGIESFCSNTIIEEPADNECDTADSILYSRKFDLFSSNASRSQTNNGYREPVQTIFETLIKNGYRYNIHIVLSIRGSMSEWRNSRVLSELSNVVLFNTFDSVEMFGNSYYLKEMLKNITSEANENTMAIWLRENTISKMRPLIYKLSETNEEKALMHVWKGEPL